MCWRKRTGFTLIELLVVISIISLLASIVTASMQDVRKRARDVKRISEIKQVIIALQLFHLDKGRFPDGTDGIGYEGQCIGGLCGGKNNSTDPFKEALLPYMSSVPRDPLHNCPDNITGTGMFNNACDDNYFYAYDFSHDQSLDFTSCASDSTGNTFSGAVVVSINKFESPNTSIKRDTCTGEGMNMGVADYNVVICRNGTSRSCFQNRGDAN
ncbi:MAG: Protein containing DUF1559 [Parcubacteria group bacterium GW2011_GWA1_47_8]|nr:MAG: Protein containing DUF1559 [Parcubacteria group bacterium GW2011_GWA1_47_8]KKW08053.1 MAG: Protein containing DUF1559 [Parcubacteria group bacterium GW2011_GWA2_49_16]